LHPPAQSLPRLYDREVQVPFRSFGLRLDGIELQSLQLHRFHGRILEGEKYLDQRVLAQAALRAKFFDQLLKRHVLVRVRAQRRFFHSIDQLAKTWISMNPCSQCQRVGEETDQSFKLSPYPIRDRCPDHDIVLT